MPAIKEIDLPTLIARFSCEDKCRDYLEELRWPEGIECPRCTDAGRRSDRISRIKERHQFHCDECTYQFSVRAGTIFHDSKLPLWKWFLAVYMMIQSRKGISANQLKRMLGVSYKTSWYLCHRIREAMRDADQRQLRGVVEADETFLGGKMKTGGGPKGKTIVLGAVQRDGQVRLKAAPNRKGHTIRAFLDEHVSDDADALYTDAYQPYEFEAREMGIPHTAVKRNDHEWVNGKVHTNTIESVWSLLDRSILGAYHKVSTKHLPRYLDELEWRFNNRENPYLFRDTLLVLIGSEQLEYKDLTGSGDQRPAAEPPF